MGEQAPPAGRLSSAAKTLADVAATGLLARGAPVLVLCSGGRDSVCLLDLARRLCSPGEVSALHVNYGLRAADSDADEALVSELCAEFDIRLEVVRADGAPRTSGNLQAWARDLRYGAASRLALSRGMLVATGHTASDQVEGILYRLASSPGRRALLGMAPRDGILVRPLLGVYREQTGVYCTERGLRWREDGTNSDSAYVRTRMRASIVPALRSIHGAAEQNVLATAELLRAEAEVLDAAVSEVLGESSQIDAVHLAALPPALARLVVMRLAERAAGRLVPGAGSRTPELLALASRTPSSGALDLASDVRARIEYGVLRMERRSAPAAGPPAGGVQELRVPGEVRFGDWQLSCKLLEGGGEPVELLERHGARGGDSGVLDADKLCECLTARSWRAGDRMSPLGMGGSTRSLADLFGARRVPRTQRSSLPILLNGEDIAWIPGVATSELFKLGPESRRAALLSAQLRRVR